MHKNKKSKKRVWKTETQDRKDGQRNRLLFWIIGMVFGLLQFYNRSWQIEAAEVYKNPETGYQVLIEDKADLLSEREEAQLAEEMQAITVYGNAALVTIEENPYASAEQFIRRYYQEHFQENSGTVFLIDMDYRKIWIQSNGRIYQTVTDSYADIITDNVYTYASKRDYYQCASKAFSQIASLLRGEKIAKPMKYICNICLSIVLAFLINYFIVMLYSKSKKPSRTEIFHRVPMQYQLKNPKVQLIRETRRYSPIQSNSGGRSSGGGGHSSGGGGHSSGGGGGHSF